MKATKLIEDLLEIIKEHGDQEVVVQGDRSTLLYTVDYVAYRGEQTIVDENLDKVKVDSCIEIMY